MSDRQETRPSIPESWRIERTLWLGAIGVRGDLVYVVPDLQAPILLRHDSISLNGYCAMPGLAKRYRSVGERYTDELQASEMSTVGTAEEVETI